MAIKWEQNSQIYTRYVRNLAIMYQKRQDLRSFTELLLSLSVIIIFGIFAIRPTLVTITELNTEIASKKDTVAKLDTKINALSTAQDLYDNNIDAIALLNDAIPTGPLPDLYARQIEGLANKNGVEIIGMNTKRVALVGSAPEEVAQVTNPTNEVITDFFPSESAKINFEVNVSGDFVALTSFLNDLESMRRPIYQDVLTIRLGSIETLGKLTLSLAGRLAYLPNEQ